MTVILEQIFNRCFLCKRRGFLLQKTALLLAQVHLTPGYRTKRLFVKEVFTMTERLHGDFYIIIDNENTIFL